MEGSKTDNKKPDMNDPEKVYSGTKNHDINRNLKMVLRIVILVAAVAFIAAGIVTHGFADVRGKAIMICLECIGIG